MARPNDTAAVYKRARRVVSARYPEDRIRLLEAIQARRGDDWLSDTVSHALDRLVEEHFPSEKAA